MASVYIVAAKRTAFGAFGGALKGFTAAQMGGIAGKAALASLPDGAKVDSVHFGGVLHSDPSSAYLARHVGHLSGLDVSVPALTINRLCGSGFQAVINAAHEIKLGEGDLIMTGGAESMSQAPYVLSGVPARFGNKYGVDLKMEDSLAAALTDRVPNPTPMGITAENLAKMYNITREDCDAYAVQSQQRWKAGLDAGAFADEITPITLKSRKGDIIFSQDEHPRPQTTVASLAKLSPVFQKGGVVTAATASGICDGASVNMVASDAAIKRFGLKPLAKVIAYHVVAVEPTIMGIGPVEAIRGALAKASLKIEDIDVHVSQLPNEEIRKDDVGLTMGMNRFDINEAFAAQFLSCSKELGLPNDKTNMFGGAIALGHPLAASGARIINNLVHNMHRLDKKYAVGAACIGGGQGIAVVLEKC